MLVGGCMYDQGGVWWGAIGHHAWKDAGSVAWLESDLLGDDVSCECMAHRYGVVSSRSRRSLIRTTSVLYLFGSHPRNFS